MGRGVKCPVPANLMNTRKTRLRRGLKFARLGFWLAVAATGWYLFAPVQLGGFDTYVLTDGTSMLPTLHGGGLVIARESSSYKVGQIAAYHSAVLGGAVILHRIVSIHDGHYTFEGDNNQQPDMYPPTQNAIVGKKWIYWGSGGTLIENLKTPWIGGPLLGLLGMWAFADLGRRKKEPRKGDGEGESEDASDEGDGTVVLRPGGKPVSPVGRERQPKMTALTGKRSLVPLIFSQCLVQDAQMARLTGEWIGDGSAPCLGSTWRRAWSLVRYRLTDRVGTNTARADISSRTVRAVDAGAAHRARLHPGRGARLVGWKVTGWAPCAWLGIAWINPGVLSIAHHFIFESASVGSSLADSLGLVLIAVLVVGLVLIGMRAPEVDWGCSRAHPDTDPGARILRVGGARALPADGRRERSESWALSVGMRVDLGGCGPVCARHAGSSMTVSPGCIPSPRSACWPPEPSWRCRGERREGGSIWTRSAPSRHRSWRC